MIDDADLHVCCHGLQKFTLLLLILQSMVNTDIFECQESTVLLVEVDVSTVDNQMIILLEVY